MATRNDAISVALGIFSGRPNPEITLAGASAEELGRLVNTAIGKEPTHPPPPARLGSYYGFVIRVPRETAARLSVPSEFSVYGGVITEAAGQQPKYWRDIANVERFLIDQSYKEGQGELLEKVGVRKP